MKNVLAFLFKACQMAISFQSPSCPFDFLWYACQLSAVLSGDGQDDIQRVSPRLSGEKMQNLQNTGARGSLGDLYNLYMYI